MSTNKTTNLNLNSWVGTDTVQRTEFVENFDLLDAEFSPTTGHKHTGGPGDAPPIGVGGVAADVGTDTVIGNRTVNPALATPASTGKLTQLLSWIAGRIKSITGTLNWYDTPAIDLQTLSAHAVRHQPGGVDAVPTAAPNGGLGTTNAAGSASSVAKSDHGHLAFDSTLPVIDGTASAGTAVVAARRDHKHPTDTTRAPLASPAFAGTPTAPTAAPGTNSLALANAAFVRAELAALVDTAPGTLDTLNELAAALGDDPNYATTTTAAIGAVSTGLAEHSADGAKHSKTARFTVGTSVSGWTSAQCDYLCDGTADQTEINAAITALPATGGEIVILDGTYNITAKISVNKSNVTLSGNGNATILKRMWDSAVIEGVITVESGISYCKIKDFYINGNNATYTATNSRGIVLKGSNHTVVNNTCNNNEKGIYVTGDNCAVANNKCNDNDSGIVLEGSNHTAINNTCNNNAEGILLDMGSNYNVTGNNVANNTCGIFCWNNNRVTISSNTCIRGTGLTTDYTASQYTINLEGTFNNYNLISSNQCMGKDVVIGGGTSNTSINNKFA